MKKYILLLFLLPFISFGQTANGTETKVNAIRSLNPQTVTSANYLTTMGTDGTGGRILPVNLPINTATQTALDLKVTANSPVTAGTYTKLTVDTKGLVTSGTSLIASDIPNILESQVTGLVSDLSAKANIANPTFTGTVTTPNLVVNNDAVINGFTVGKGTGNIYSNTVFGHQAGVATPTFSDANVFIGYEAGLSNTGGRENVFIGYQAGRNYTSSGDPVENGLNVFIGSLSGLNTTTGISNTFVGQKSGVNNTTGSYNSFIGVHSAHSFTSGNHNIVFGKSFDNGTASGITGDFNVIVGNDIGAVSGVKSRNSIFGYGSGVSMTASASNSMFGYRNGIALTSGNSNTLIGYQAGYNITTGSSNINIGNNITTSNSNITTGSNNIIIGNDIQAASATASNQLNIGNIIFGTGLSGSGSTVAGRIGIGTTSPNSILEISEPTAQVRVTSSTSNNPVSIRFANGVASFIGNEGSSGGSLLPGSSAFATVINTQGGAAIQFGTANTLRATLSSGGNLGIGVTNPTASVHIKAGTATAGTAPLKLNSGTNLTTTEAGAIEFDGTHLYATLTNGGARQQLDGNFITATTSADYYRGDKTMQPLNGAVIGSVLTGFSASAGTVASTDTVLQGFNKLVGNQALKADLASPALTGTPTAPTASPGTNTTQLATTAFVQNAVDTDVNIQKIVDNANRYAELDGGDSQAYELYGSVNNRRFSRKIGSGGDYSEFYAVNTQVLMTNENSGISTGTVDISNGLISVVQSRLGFGATSLAIDPALVNTTWSTPAFSVAGSYKYASQPKEYLVSALPTPTGSDSRFAIVTDALAPTYMAAIVGGGSVVCPVFWNGSGWVAN